MRQLDEFRSMHGPVLPIEEANYSRLLKKFIVYLQEAEKFRSEVDEKMREIAR